MNKNSSLSFLPVRKRKQVLYAMCILLIIIALSGGSAFVAKQLPTITQILPEAGPIVNQFLPTIAPEPGQATVVSVTDGDTIKVQLSGQTKTETVRLLGVDTPETKDPRRSVQCFGINASDHTKSLLPTGTTITMVADPLNSDRDKYDRLLRYIYLADGSMLNAALVRDGYAFAYTVYPIEKEVVFKQFEQEAKSASRGLWGGCSVDDSSKVKQTNPQN